MEDSPLRWPCISTTIGTDLWGRQPRNAGFTELCQTKGQSSHKADVYQAASWMYLKSSKLATANIFDTCGGYMHERSDNAVYASHDRTTELKETIRLHENDGNSVAQASWKR